MALKNTNKTYTNTYVLEITVDGDAFKKAIDKVYRKQVKNINIHGFRKGKAPKAVIEKMYGKEVFYDDAMQECYPEALEAAVREAELKLVAVDALEAVEAGDEGFTFKATIIVEPEITIEGYKGIEFEKKSTEVTEDHINDEIEKVRDRNSRMVTVDNRAAENGDVVVIDFEGFVDGEAFDGGKAENYNLKLGAGQCRRALQQKGVGRARPGRVQKDVAHALPLQAKAQQRAQIVLVGGGLPRLYRAAQDNATNRRIARGARRFEAQQFPLGAGPAALDVVHAQLVQTQSDLHLVRRGELHVLALCAVAQCGVIESVFPAHGVPVTALPRRKGGD